MYDFRKSEEEVLAFWEKSRIYEKAKAKNDGKKKFYYLDGPPYTSGKIHVGHAWGKALRDSIIRYKRMRGFDVWDQPGFDMHGLPIEVAVEKKLGIKDKKEVISTLGLAKFIEECRNFSIAEMHPMINDFKRIGIWMDWDDPYMTIKNEYIEGAWWALKKAHENGYLYKGLKTMTWCPRCATALAKHELNYETINDKSIFVKFPVVKHKNTFMIIWTTTSWTLPFNLAVMAHPDFDYVKAKIEDTDETWILAKGLAGAVITAVAGKKFKVIEEFKGKKLEGLKYRTPFYEDLPYHHELDKKSKKAYTVLMSDKYVDLSSGSGLVHCAPGCGPEDFEIGRQNKLPPYNELDEHGTFSQNMGKFSGMKARVDDSRFIDALEKKGLIIAITDISHEYAKCWRCNSDVVFRTTEQWFLAVEKLKEKMRDANKKIYWVPDWGGSRWFDSWLSNLQDWCISRQRFWGIPLPIWVCSNPKCNNFILVESKAELEQLGKKDVGDLHRPFVDEVIIDCPKCNSHMHRVEDVLDVWLDSGAASWAPLKYPSEKDTFKRFWPADLILEGKDQIRGWFNSMICLSMVSFKKPPYKAVYMHGFVNDAHGRKMSKSLKNIISPYEVIDKYGADTLRFYTISGASPGLDLNYNFEDTKLKHKNLEIFWNILNFIRSQSDFMDRNPKTLKVRTFGVEEKYILSRLNSTIDEVTKLFDAYRLNETPQLVEKLFLDLSRTYIQMVREKASTGSEKEKAQVLYATYNVYLETLKLLSPIAPFITEKCYQELKEKFKLDKESVHLQEWPKADKKMINKKLEEQMEFVKTIIQEALAQREKAQLGVRWPLKKLLVTADDAGVEAVNNLKDVLMFQLNVKAVRVDKGNFSVALDTELTPELEAEGFSREITRRIQEMRKKANLKKQDLIELSVVSSYDLSKFKKEVQKKVGAKTISFEKPRSPHHGQSVTIKGREFEIYFSLVKN
ncbi:MAG: isoleucine--tRNA ligase [archaeon]